MVKRTRDASEHSCHPKESPKRKIKKIKNCQNEQKILNFWIWGGETPSNFKDFCLRYFFTWLAIQV